MEGMTLRELAEGLWYGAVQFFLGTRLYATCYALSPGPSRALSQAADALVCAPDQHGAAGTDPRLVGVLGLFWFWACGETGFAIL